MDSRLTSPSAVEKRLAGMTTLEGITVKSMPFGFDPNHAEGSTRRAAHVRTSARSLLGVAGRGECADQPTNGPTDAWAARWQRGPILAPRTDFMMRRFVSARSAASAWPSCPAHAACASQCVSSDALTGAAEDGASTFCNSPTVTVPNPCTSRAAKYFLESHSFASYRAQPRRGTSTPPSLSV